MRAEAKRFRATHRYVGIALVRSDTWGGWRFEMGLWWGGFAVMWGQP